MRGVENMAREKDLTMCWFGVRQPLATSVVHVPEQVINPDELITGPLIFIWDKFMKAPNVTELVGEPIPWSPALLEGYERKWIDDGNGITHPELLKKENGKCLGCVLLTTRTSDNKIQFLINDYEKRGYKLKEKEVLIGDLNRVIRVFLPK